MEGGAMIDPSMGGAKLWVLSFVLACGLGFVGLIGIGCAIGANACPFTDAAPTEQSLDGEVIFTRNCAVCHGIEADGGQGGPSLIAGAPATRTLAELQEKISRGRPFKGMPRFKGELSPAQIEAVARAVIARREAS